MSDGRNRELLFELFSGLPRQGPGDVESTQRALALVPPLGPASRILDVGCRTGAVANVERGGGPRLMLKVRRT